MWWPVSFILFSNILSLGTFPACPASLIAQTVKESAYNVSDSGSIPRSQRFPGEENGYPLRYFCLENSMDRRAWLGYSPWDHKESDTTEQLTLNFRGFIIDLNFHWLVFEELMRPRKLQPFQTCLRSFVLLLSEKAKQLPPPRAALGLDLRIPQWVPLALSWFTYWLLIHMHALSVVINTAEVLYLLKLWGSWETYFD